MTSADRQRVLKLARRRQGVSAREVSEAGIHRQALTRLVADGRLVRVMRGLYRLPSHAPSENHGLVLASMAAPHAVVCLLSALQFHGVGTQSPSDVWIALDRRARAPELRFPPLRVVRFSGPALTEGVQRHRMEGREVAVYSLEKTLADCFKYRNKIGLDVALEAIREARRMRKIDSDALWRYARIDRVTNVIRPYLEALA